MYPAAHTNNCTRGSQLRFKWLKLNLSNLNLSQIFFKSVCTLRLVTKLWFQVLRPVYSTEHNLASTINRTNEPKPSAFFQTKAADKYGGGGGKRRKGSGTSRRGAVSVWPKPPNICIDCMFWWDILALLRNSWLSLKVKPFYFSAVVVPCPLPTPICQWLKRGAILALAFSPTQQLTFPSLNMPPWSS